MGTPLFLLAATALVVFVVLGLAEWYIEEDELDEPTLTRRVRTSGSGAAAMGRARRAARPVERTKRSA